MFFFSLRIKWHAFNEYAKCEYKKLLDQKKKRRRRGYILHRKNKIWTFCTLSSTQMNENKLKIILCTNKQHKKIIVNSGINVLRYVNVW